MAMNKEELKQYRIVWCIINKERVQKSKSEWYKRNKKRIAMKHKNRRSAITLLLKDWRHRTGITKKFREDCNISKSREYKLSKRHSSVEAGYLSVATVQKLYKNNIKKYGILTCYLCKKPIIEGKETLDHKLCLFRGGTNKYSNLGISCAKCNGRKHIKTVKEYKKYLKNLEVKCALMKKKMQ
jgi:5-methylcytosine-specific restriction endonuclease McrA